MERAVEIPVSQKLRAEIKVLKREKTYEEFLKFLLKNNKKKTFFRARPRRKIL